MNINQHSIWHNKLLGAYLMLFRVIAHINLLLHKTNYSTIVKYRSGKIPYFISTVIR